MTFYQRFSIFQCKYVANVPLPNFRVGGVTNGIKVRYQPEIYGTKCHMKLNAYRNKVPNKQ